MTIKKTWAHIHFISNDQDIEAAINYETKDFTLSSEHDDQSVSFRAEDLTIDESIERAKCVLAALKYIKQELA